MPENGLKARCPTRTKIIVCEEFEEYEELGADY
jgi:hypothetical protein